MYSIGRTGSCGKHKSAGKPALLQVLEGRDKALAKRAEESQWGRRAVKNGRPLVVVQFARAPNEKWLADPRHQEQAKQK